MSKRVKTVYEKEFIHGDVADELFNHLRDSIDWDDSIYSRKEKSITRKGKAIDLDSYDDEKLLSVIFLVLEHYNVSIIHGVYLNYYRDGNDFTPVHKHEATNQIIISLGCTRTLTVGKKEYQIGNGDIMYFGSSLHGIKKDTECNDERISIAIFCSK